MNLKSIKVQLILFLTCFAIYLAVRDKDLVFLLGTSVAVITAMLTETTILYFKEKKFRFTDSSIISGLIIGYVLTGYQQKWILALAAIFAIASKYLIRFQKKHIFNPAGLGVFLAIIVFSASTQWKGTYLWYILAPFGLYFIYKIKKMELLLSYFITTLILFGAQAVMQKVPLKDIFGYLSYFYIFIMAIEPKTTPVFAPGKIIFGIGLAVMIFILSNVGVRFDVELFSLLLLNLFVPALNKLHARKGG
jgi:Na+-translocating ferredoxin:NAD+ oxidoreductase RnfD subunit